MFQFRRFPTYTYVFSIRWLDFSSRVAPFGNPRIYRLLTAPRGLSQLTTSFFGSQCQGIRPAPFVAWPFFNPLLFLQRILCDPLNDLSSFTRSIIVFNYPFINIVTFQRRLSQCPISRLSCILCSVFKVRFRSKPDFNTHFMSIKINLRQVISKK